MMLPAIFLILVSHIAGTSGRSVLSPDMVNVQRESYWHKRSENPETLVSRADGSPIPGLAESRTSHNEALIVNGRDAIPGEFPWMVSLQVTFPYGSVHICGGSLWKRNKVITAAHCLDGFVPDQFQAALGYNQLSLGDLNPNSELIAVTRADIHPLYRPSGSVSNDIAVFTLERDADINSFVSTITINTNPPSFYANKNVTATGWGITKGTTHDADILQVAEFSVLSKDDCKNYFDGYDVIGDTGICTLAKCAQLCNGDSGGPIVYQRENGTYEQVGVVSWGHVWCNPISPGVSESPGMFTDWLNTV